MTGPARPSGVEEARVDEAPGWPRRVQATGAGVSHEHSAARLRAERRGLALGEGHPLRPEVVAQPPGALVFASYGDPWPTPEEALLEGAWGQPERIAGSRRWLLREVCADPRPDRAARHLGVARRHVDRWLDQEVVAVTRRGLSLGGIAPAWFREQGGRAAALRWDRARVRGWLAADLAGLAVHDDDRRSALRLLHRAAAAGDPRADEAFDIALFALTMRELSLAGADAWGEGAPLADRARAALEPRLEPEDVRVTIEAPPFVRPDQWHAPGSLVSASRARWLLAHLDGQSVGGGVIAVRTEPPIRGGRRAPRREPRGDRRRALFSRWDQGIQVDDEGLLSATPEALALRFARGAAGTVIDGTAGVGALTIALARQPAVRRVIAVDVHEGRLAMARHNAGLYGVADRIEWVRAPVQEVLSRRRADLLVLDPPWGGRGYDRDAVGLEDLPFDLAGVLSRFRGAVRLKLPRSFLVEELPGPGVAGQGVAAPGVAGPGVAGPGVAGPGVAGQGNARPGVAGQGNAGPGVAGQGNAGPGVAAAGVAAPGVPGGWRVEAVVDDRGWIKFLRADRAAAE